MDLRFEVGLEPSCMCRRVYMPFLSRPGERDASESEGERDTRGVAGLSALIERESLART